MRPMYYDKYDNGSDASKDHDNDGLNDSIDTDDDNDDILDVDEVGGAVVSAYQIRPRQ
jgi:hypothetical protein